MGKRVIRFLTILAQSECQSVYAAKVRL
jgi:hypothetical protein